MRLLQSFFEQQALAEGALVRDGEVLVIGRESKRRDRLIPYCLQQGWQIRNLQTPLVRVNFQRDGISYSALAQYRGAKSMLQANGEALLARDPKKYAMYCSVVGFNAFKLGRHGESRKFFLKAIRYRPGHWKYHAAFLLSLAPSLGRRVFREDPERRD